MRRSGRVCRWASGPDALRCAAARRRMNMTPLHFPLMFGRAAVLANVRAAARAARRPLRSVVCPLVRRRRCLATRPKRGAVPEARAQRRGRRSRIECTFPPPPQCGRRGTTPGCNRAAGACDRLLYHHTIIRIPTKLLYSTADARLAKATLEGVVQIVEVAQQREERVSKRVKHSQVLSCGASKLGWFRLGWVRGQPAWHFGRSKVPDGRARARECAGLIAPAR